MRETIRKFCAEMGVMIIDGALSSDHLHMFVEIPPHVSVSDRSDEDGVLVPNSGKVAVSQARGLLEPEQNRTRKARSRVPRGTCLSEFVRAKLGQAATRGGTVRMSGDEARGELAASRCDRLHRHKGNCLKGRPCYFVGRRLEDCGR